MSDLPDSSESAPQAQFRPDTAGGMLRQARQAQGLHIAALAASIKVTPRKLELLESDQFDQLTDATFTRALAQAVCRSLKIDAAPVLALLPPLRGHRLEQVAQGLNTPFTERPGRLVPKDWADAANPVLWITALVVLVTLAVYLVPSEWMTFSSRPAESSAATPAPVVEVPTAGSPPLAAGPLVAAASASEGAAVAVPPDAIASEAGAPMPAAVEVPAPAPSGVLQVRATAESWIGVTDARGQSLIGRVLQPGETVGLDGAMPLKVRIGNAGGTEIVFKGQPFGLAAYTRDNVARFELK